MRAFSFILITGLAGGICLSLSAQAPEGRWSSAAPLAQPRAEHSVIELGGKIYAIAGGIPNTDGKGMQNGGASTLVEEYDPATDRWQRRAPLPRALTHVGLAAMNGAIYAIGGFQRDVHQQAQADAFLYDPASDRWTDLPPLPSPRGSVGAVALNGRIHAIGGRSPDNLVSASHDIYDPVKKTWSAAPPLPAARDHLSAIAVNGMIHVIGGRTADYTAVTALHDIYDPKAGTWSEGPAMPSPRSSMAATLYRNMIVVFGGECRGGKTFPENEGYDLAARRWRTLTPADGRHGFGGATVGDRAYFVAGPKGCGSSAVSDELLVFTLP